jgi:HK97 family phage portal protein
MSLWQRLRDRFSSKAAKAAPAMLSPLLGPCVGWWHDDPHEQVRNFRSWVYAAVTAIAQEVAKHRPFGYRETGPAEHEQIPLAPAHPLMRLLADPNPWLTPWELWYLTIVYLELTGNCYWYAPPLKAGTADLGVPGELWVIPSPWVHVLPDATRFVRGYEVTPPGSATEFVPANDVIHLKYPSPHDPHYGLSPLQANALAVDANSELQRSRYQAFCAGQRPGVVLATEQTLSDATVRRLEERIQSRLGGRENWHRPLVLEQGLKASPWTLSPAEMDFLNSSRLTRDEILAVYRVPLPIAGVSENLGLGKDIWLGARVMFCEGTVQPKLDLIAQVLTRDLARRYGPDVAIAFPDISPRMQDERRADDEMDARMGIRTIDEIRAARGLGPIEVSREVPAERAPLSRRG